MRPHFNSRQLLVVSFFILALPYRVSANNEVQRLVDSYLIAKTDNRFLNDDEVKNKPYTIQVASYINEKDAASHVEELRIQEREVRYVPVFVRDQIWYKVLVGLFDKKETAEAYKKSFMQRVDEPFSVVISMLDRPDKVLASRHTASVGKEISIKKETTIKINPEVKTNLSYSLQIGAFPEEEIAKQHLAKFFVKDQPTEIRSALVNGKTWYRVFVGRFQNKKEAESFQSQFSKQFSQQSQGAESFIRRLGAPLGAG